MKIQKPMAANITSVSTRTVDDAMVVCLRDSNQRVKWSANSMPAAMAAITSFFVNLFISGRDFFSDMGRRMATVQPSRYVAVISDGAEEYLTNMAETDTPSTPRNKRSFGFILSRAFIFITSYILKLFGVISTCKIINDGFELCQYSLTRLFCY